MKTLKPQQIQLIILIALSILVVFVVYFKRKMKNPLPNAKITSRYGNRTHPTTGQQQFHNGIDLAKPKGTPIFAPDFGRVEKVFTNNIGGKQLTIKHFFRGFKSGYAHCDKIHVKQGDFVYPTKHIADVGNTGRSTGPHLHLTLRKNGELVNPENYFKLS